MEEIISPPLLDESIISADDPFEERVSWLRPNILLLLLFILLLLLLSSLLLKLLLG